MTRGTAEAMGVMPSDLQQAALPADAKRLLEVLLRSRGFDMARTVTVSELASGEGFLLTQ